MDRGREPPEYLAAREIPIQCSVKLKSMAHVTHKFLSAPHGFVRKNSPEARMHLLQGKEVAILPQQHC